MRTVVVGASSGLGRCLASGLVARGARVAVLARRYDRLVELSGEIGENAIPIACDVMDEASCRSAVEEAAAGLGGIDGLVYATGAATLSRLADTGAEAWRRTLDTNVVGAALVTSAALPYLTETSGVAAFLSSVSASMTAPWPGLGAYAVSKAALDKLVEAWRNEYPTIGFTRVVVGECPGGRGHAQTEFTTSWDGELAAEMGAIWLKREYFNIAALLDVENLINVVDSVLRCGATASIPSVTVAARPTA